MPMIKMPLKLLHVVNKHTHTCISTRTKFSFLLIVVLWQHSAIYNDLNVLYMYTLHIKIQKDIFMARV